MAQKDRCFHLFPQLPPELRLRIWRHTLPRERVVPVNLDSTPSSGRAYCLGRTSKGCVSSAPIPHNLHTCHESRTEALKQFSLSFGVCNSPGQVFFNPASDILYFGACPDQWEAETQFQLFTSMVHPEELGRVRRIAIDDSIFWPEPHYVSSIAARLTVDILDKIRSRFPALEELVFVPRDNHTTHGGDATLVDPDTPNYRLQRQIHEGMQVVAQAHPGWRAPNWSIKELSYGLQTTRTRSPAAGQLNLCQQKQEPQRTSPFSYMDQGVLRCFAGF